MSAKGKKKKSMTDEENLLYMEQKMLLEAEAKRKKEDLLNQFLKDKLSKEEKNTKINLFKINDQWRSIMRDLKTKELRKDIEILSQTFERIIDRKDSVIKSIVKDLQEAEEQYAMAIRSHFKNIDDLTDLQREQLLSLAEKYEENISRIKYEFDREREAIESAQNSEMNELQNIIYGMEKIFLDQETEALNEFQNLRDDIKNKNLEEKQTLRAALVERVEELWKQFDRINENYKETTEEKKKQFEELKAKDEKSAEEIDKQMKLIQNLLDSINTLKTKISQNAKEAQEANHAIKENRDVMNAHFHDLKVQMKQIQDANRKKLTKLTKDCDEVLNCLKKKKEKAEQILHFAEMCRKLETEEEKVLPFYASSLTEEEEQDVHQAVLEQPSTQLATIMKDYLSVENFWKRYNKVLLDKIALEKEKQMLSNENAQLRVLLKQYLDGISVNDEVLSQTNPLFIVNHRSNVRMNISLNDGRVERNPKVAIEAKDHLKHTIY